MSNPTLFLLHPKLSAVLSFQDNLSFDCYTDDAKDCYSHRDYLESLDGNLLNLSSNAQITYTFLPFPVHRERVRCTVFKFLPDFFTSYKM